MIITTYLMFIKGKGFLRRRSSTEPIAISRIRYICEMFLFDSVISRTFFRLACIIVTYLDCYMANFSLLYVIPCICLLGMIFTANQVDRYYVIAIDESDPMYRSEIRREMIHKVFIVLFVFSMTINGIILTSICKDVHGDVTFLTDWALEKLVLGCLVATAIVEILIDGLQIIAFNFSSFFLFISFFGGLLMFALNLLFDLMA